VSAASDLRFEFGKNWARFLRRLTPERIAIAEDSLKDMLAVADLTDNTFLDVGCGSGLFSLAARRLGATTHSFDYDADSVACAVELKRRYFPGDDRWTIERGSALDDAYLRSLSTYDVVYAWGVLHHTGDMWRAIDLVARRVAVGGRLFLAIYNDQGLKSRFWRGVKRLCNTLPRFAQAPFAIVVMAPFELRLLLKALIAGQPGRYFRNWSDYQSARGMDHWHDTIDWVGGYPFEVATRPELIAFCARRGFSVNRVEASKGLGCNQLVFTRVQ
jgi:2-polyprenyl-6-hydroxyphenyl methylase/3-demethylubiquinone-9 3-methyltransferase